MICLFCSRTSKFSGRKNPNTRYANLDDTFFEAIDSEEKAYALGWIASDGSITSGVIALFVHPKDKDGIEHVRNTVCRDLPFRERREGKLVGFTISSKRIAESVCRHLRIRPGKKDAVVGFPELSSDALRWAFIRGYFDGDGSVVTPGTRTAPRCTIASTSDGLLNAVRSFAGLPAYQMHGRLEWNGNAALDFLSRIYDGATVFLLRKRSLYVDWCVWVPGLSGPSGRDLQFRWTKSLPNALPPTKARASDSGFDLTLIARGEAKGEVVFYRTGIKVQPEYGWYFDLVARSSITKSGYMLANGIGVIDRTYIGEILVPLVKVDRSKPDLALPARVVQIIPRPVIHAELVEVPALDDTERGSGGFGSTG